MKVKMLGLASIALSLCGLFAASASAHTWRINGAELTSPREITATAKIEFNETSTEERDKCTFNIGGTVGAGAAGKIASITSTSGAKAVKCEHAHGTYCLAGYETEAVNLPWATELVTINGLLRDEFKSGGGGTPGWSVKCNGIFGKVSFTCTASKNAGIANGLEAVEATFDEKSPRSTCTLGAGSEQLITSGPMTLRDAKGLTLSAT